MADESELIKMFQLCSPDGEGNILTDSLVRKLAEQLNSHDLLALKNALDPKSEGKISFHQFTGAITLIKENGGALTTSSNPVFSEVHNKALSNSEEVQNCFSIKNGSFNPITLPVKEDYGSSSEPDSTYNEYDIPEGDDMTYSFNGDDAEDFEGNGELRNCGSSTRFNVVCSPEQGITSKRTTSTRLQKSSFSHCGLLHYGVLPNIASDDSNIVDESASLTSDLEDLSEKVDVLKDHVAKLTEERKLQIQYETVNRENQQLVLRNHELEERVVSLEEKMNEMKKAHESEMIALDSKLTRESQLMSQVLQEKLQNSLKDSSILSAELNELKGKLSKVHAENNFHRDKVELLTSQVLEINEEYMRLNKQASSQREKLENDVAVLNAVNEKIRLELEVKSATDASALELLNSIEDSERSMSAAILSAKLSTLEVENERLKSVNEDLNIQLARNIADARALMGTSTTTENSIASEMVSASRDEVVEALQKKEAENKQLREYLDKIILSVLEKDPSILEIK